jgi:kynurenine formamidase
MFYLLQWPEKSVTLKTCRNAQHGAPSIFTTWSQTMSPRIVDLSLTLYHGIRGLTTEQHSTYSVEGYNTTMLHLYSHTATHMDAPLHFVPDGGTIDQIPLDRCIGPALVVDLSHVEPNSLIEVADLAAHAGRIGPGTRLLLRTDWSRHAEQEDYRTHMPRISADLARWLVQKEVALLGVEQPSVASLRPENRAELTEVHQILLAAGIVIVEGLANLHALTGEVVHFIALPLKIRGCDGSPVRAVAVLDENDMQV